MHAPTRNWSNLAALIRTASDSVSAAMLAAMLELPDCPAAELAGLERAIKAIQAAEDELSGLSYLCTPQSEWLGNDSKGEPMFATRLPHICRS